MLPAVSHPRPHRPPPPTERGLLAEVEHETDFNPTNQHLFIATTKK